MANFFADAVRFFATSSGTGDFVVNSAVQGFRTPAAASVPSASTSAYRAESSTLNEWEEGIWTYTSGTTTCARTTVTANHLGTTAKVSFTAAPQVALVLASADIVNASNLATGTVNGLRLPMASLSDQATATSAVVTVSPSVQQAHPSAAKAWAQINVSGTTPTIAYGYNVASISRSNVGAYTITFTNALPSANMIGVGAALNAGDTFNIAVEQNGTPTTTTYGLAVKSNSSGIDRSFSIAIFGV